MNTTTDKNNNLASSASTSVGKRTPKRLCRFPGCARTIKSQGHCQGHGAVVKTCKVPDCTKQMQGGCDGMCTKHWNRMHNPPKVKCAPDPPQMVGTSVYERIIPSSVAWKGVTKNLNSSVHTHKATPLNVSNSTTRDNENQIQEMPLVEHFKKNFHLEAGWHRNQERASRGATVASVSAQLEPWEKQLLMFETMLISGTVHNNIKSWKAFSHAWGRDKRFITNLVGQICERKGDMSRKNRSDMGKKLTESEKTRLREKSESRKRARIKQEPEGL
mmetsp:Transcript_17605/g.20376  ORF Transcript_17605/g.20376 Transcript_17605/m.20376 type:complete len:274 (+) Transcript_17605:97-918(+)